MLAAWIEFWSGIQIPKAAGCALYRDFGRQVLVTPRVRMVRSPFSCLRYPFFFFSQQVCMCVMRGISFFPLALSIFFLVQPRRQSQHHAHLSPAFAEMQLAFVKIHRVRVFSRLRVVHAQERAGALARISATCSLAPKAKISILDRPLGL